MMRRGRKSPGPTTPVKGSGPGGTVELADIRTKLGDLRGDVDQVATDARPYLTYAIAAAAVAIVAIAFLSGRRTGRRKSTWVEVKRL